MQMKVSRVIYTLIRQSRTFRGQTLSCIYPPFTPTGHSDPDYAPSYQEQQMGFQFIREGRKSYRCQKNVMLKCWGFLGVRFLCGSAKWKWWSHFICYRGYCLLFPIQQTGSSLFTVCVWELRPCWVWRLEQGLFSVPTTAWAVLSQKLKQCLQGPSDYLQNATN